MEKHNLREEAKKRCLWVILLALSSFSLGAYSEKANFTAWGWVTIAFGIVLFAAALFMLMRDLWSTDD